jgi:hypothetical protein
MTLLPVESINFGADAASVLEHIKDVLTNTGFQQTGQTGWELHPAGQLITVYVLGISEPGSQNVVLQFVLGG